MLEIDREFLSEILIFSPLSLFFFSLEEASLSLQVEGKPP